MKKRLSVVIWDDAHSTIDELDADGIRAGHRPNTVHTYGYIVVSDEKGVSIAGEWLPATQGEDTYRNITFILRSMVRQEGPAVKRARTKPEVIPTV
jgi:hypothetical protein